MLATGLGGGGFTINCVLNCGLGGGTGGGAGVGGGGACWTTCAFWFVFTEPRVLCELTGGIRERTLEMIGVSYDLFAAAALVPTPIKSLIHICVITYFIKK